MAINADIPIFRGEDVQLPITIVDEDDAPLDITAWSDLTFTIRRAYGEAELVKKTTADPAEMEITDAENGELVVTLTDDDTNELTALTHVYDLKRMDAGGEVVLLYGRVLVHAAATA